MRRIDNIVLHCTATAQTAKVSSIVRYWKEQLGWRKPGYHFIIEASGKVTNLLPIEEVSNGVKNHNAHSIHISYIGGVDANGKAVDNRTTAQECAQINLLKKLSRKFPEAKICGHRDFPNVHKDCPSFDVATWLNTVHL